MEAKALNRLGDKLLLICGVAACLFHLYTGMFGVYTAFKQRLIHLVLIGVVALMSVKKGKKRNPLDWLLSACLLGSMAYFLIGYSSFAQRGGNFTNLDLTMGVSLLITVLYITKKHLGWPIVVIASIALLYAFFGSYIPGNLGHKGFSPQRLISHLTLGTEGILGSPIGASATFVIVFVIMAAFLDKSGTGDFFINTAMAMTGKRRGGPAKAAVVASGLFGTISGSSVANVVSTGTFTIPLMKKTGFQPPIAAAVESVASTGGQLMPPIMGAGAFIMSEVTGIPYLKIMVAAIIPALLYYLALYFCIDNYSAKNGLEGSKAEDLPNLRQEMRQSGHMLIPLVILVGSLLMGFSALRSGFLGTMSVLVFCCLRKNTRMSPKTIIAALDSAAKGSVSVTCACACAGIIMGVMTLTGLGLKFSAIIIAYSMGIKSLALILTMVSALLLGMGLPTVASYIMLSILVAPALIDLGISQLAAHMFVFYFGLLSAITPPVAVASFAAAGIAEAPLGKTGFASVKLGLTAFIVPYMFVYGEELLIIGTPLNIIQAAITALVGVYFLAASTEGWALRSPVGILRRFGLFAAALLLITPGLYSDLGGIALGVVCMAKNIQEYRIVKRNKDGVLVPSES